MRRLLPRVLVSALALVFGLGVGEVAFRVREGPEHSQSLTRVRPDPLLGWAPIHDQDIEIRTPEYAVSDHYNNFGMLGADVTVAKPPNTYRVLALGDSILEAVQVPRPERFSSLIQEDLAQSLGRPVEVLNTGVFGYQNDQEILYYESTGKSFHADLVLLFLYVGNDVMGNTTTQRVYGEGPILKPRFHLEGDRLVLEPLPVDAAGRPLVDPWDTRLSVSEAAPGSGFRTVTDALYRASALYRALADAAYRARGLTTVPPVPHGWLLFRADGGGPAVDEAWSVTEALLGRLRDDVIADGARLGVVVVPDAIQSQPDDWRSFLATYRLPVDEWDVDAPQRRIAEICRRRAIECLDVLPSLRAIGRGLIFPIDRHLTPAGHRIVGSEVSRWLASSGLAH